MTRGSEAGPNYSEEDETTPKIQESQKFFGKDSKVSEKDSKLISRVSELKKHFRCFRWMTRGSELVPIILEEDKKTLEFQ
jgi:hypothetical protein